MKEQHHDVLPKTDEEEAGRVENWRSLKNEEWNALRDLLRNTIGEIEKLDQNLQDPARVDRIIFAEENDQKALREILEDSEFSNKLIRLEGIVKNIKLRYSPSS